MVRVTFPPRALPLLNPACGENRREFSSKSLYVTCVTRALRIKHKDAVQQFRKEGWLFLDLDFLFPKRVSEFK